MLRRIRGRQAAAEGRGVASAVRQPGAAPLARGAAGDGAPLRAAIAAVHFGGNTRLYGGWREGAEKLMDLAGTGLKRVILLPDRQATEGLTDAAAITAPYADWATRG